MATSTEALEKKIKHLEMEVNHLHQLFYLAAAGSIGLQQYALARISKLTESDQEKEMVEFVLFSQQAYDKLISGLEDVNPALAAAVDVRDTLAPACRDRWYFPLGPK